MSSPMSCSFDNSIDTNCMNTNRNNDSKEGYTSTDGFQKIGIQKNNTNDTINDIGNAIVCDVKEGKGGDVSLDMR
jgi:hypothetical protein